MDSVALVIGYFTIAFIICFLSVWALSNPMHRFGRRVFASSNNFVTVVLLCGTIAGGFTLIALFHPH